jgi:hypothetical protein
MSELQIVVGAMGQSLSTEHESHLAARKSEDSVKVDLRNANTEIARLRQELSDSQNGANRNNPKEWKRLLQLAEDIDDDAGKLEDGGITYSQYILACIQRGDLCNGLKKEHIPCRYERDHQKSLALGRAERAAKKTAQNDPDVEEVENAPKKSKKQKRDIVPPNKV